MNKFTLQQKRLIIMAPILVLFEISAFQLLVRIWDSTWGYLSGYILYWFLWCIPVSAIYLRNYKRRDDKSFVLSKKRLLSLLLVIMPVVSTGLVVFPEYASIASGKVLFLALLFACINAPLEELVWRKVFPAVFSANIWFGFLFPTLCFTAWHLAPALAKDSGMGGGVSVFVGSALFMGFVWGWYSYRYKSVMPSIIAHLLTNFFAFTGFLYINWFS